MDVNCYSRIHISALLQKCFQFILIHSQLNSKQNTVLPVVKTLRFYNSESVSPFADLGL